MKDTDTEPKCRTCGREIVFREVGVLEGPGADPKYPVTVSFGSCADPLCRCLPVPDTDTEE